MKLKRIMLCIFSVLPLAVSTVALFFLPDRIPAHYGQSFTVDRYGSKYEILIFPVIIIVVGMIILLTAKLINDEVNKKLTLNIGLALILFFNALDYFILFIQARALTDLSSIGIERFLLLAFGILFIYMGNLMPMSKRNSLVGLRTKWSNKNDYVWKKCQIFGGVSLIIIGIVLSISAFVYPSIILMLILLMIFVVASVIYSYFAAKKDTHSAD